MFNEEIFWHGEPAEVVVLYWAIERLKLVLISIGIILYLYIKYATMPDLDTLFMYLGGIISLYLLSIVYSFFLRKTYKYSISNQTVNFEGGILNKKSKNIPFRMITDVTKSQSIIQKFFGLSDIYIQTAGTADFPEICFIGLKDTDTPKEYIMQKIKYSTQQK